MTLIWGGRAPMATARPASRWAAGMVKPVPRAVVVDGGADASRGLVRLGNPAAHALTRAGKADRLGSGPVGRASMLRHDGPSRLADGAVLGHGSRGPMRTGASPSGVGPKEEEITMTLAAGAAVGGTA